MPLRWSWVVVKSHECAVVGTPTHHERSVGIFLEWHGASGGEHVDLSEECTCERAEDIRSPSLSAIDGGG